MRIFFLIPLTLGLASLSHYLDGDRLLSACLAVSAIGSLIAIRLYPKRGAV